MPMKQQAARGPAGAAARKSAGPFVPILRAGVSGLAATFLILLACSWAFTRTRIPPWAAVPMATGAVCLGCFVCGRSLAKSFRKNGLFCGLCAGAAFFVLYLAAALFNGQFDFTALAGIKLVCYILSGCMGGYLGILATEKKAHTQR